MTGRVVALGECMVEFAPAGEGLYRRGFAGDVFNTAWYLRRLMPSTWDVDFATCVGTDRLSDAFLAFASAAGLGTAGVRRIPDRALGLYAIEVEAGERRFAYWRGQSAARLIAEDPGWLAGALAGARLVCLSGITVAILPAAQRPTLLAALRAARAAGARVAFDPNIRPRLWEDEASLRSGIEAAAAVADVLLPSFDDERTHFGDADPAATIARYRGLGATTVAVKDGPREARAWDAAEGEAAVLPAPLAPVDTTAAGDSFDAAFLAARLSGSGLAAALGDGVRLAGRVCGVAGALAPLDP